MKRLSKGLRKFIRREKSRLRWEVLDSKERAQKFQELYQKFSKGVESK